MAYRSPISVLSHFGESGIQIDPTSINRLQKRLLIELDMESGSYLTIGDKEFTKDDILQLFQELKSNDFLHFHQIIFENKGLLNLLESGDFDSKEFLSSEVYYRKDIDEFRQFLSPILAEPLSKALNKVYNQQLFQKGIPLIQLGQLILPNDFDATFSRLRQSILHTIKLIQMAGFESKKGLDQEIRELEFIHNFNFINFLNQLPSGMEKMREDLVRAVISLTARLQTRAVRFSQLIYIGFSNLDVSTQLKEVIEKNRMVTSSWKLAYQTQATRYKTGQAIQQKTKSEANNSNFSAVRAVILVFVVFGTLIRIGVSCNGNKSNYSRNKNFNEQIIFSYQKAVQNSRLERNFRNTLLSIVRDQIKNGDTISSDKSAYHDPNRDVAEGDKKVALASLNNKKNETQSPNQETEEIVPDISNHPFEFLFSDLHGKTGVKNLAILNSSEMEVIVMVLGPTNYSTKIGYDEMVEFHTNTNEKIFFYVGSDWGSADSIAFEDPVLKGERNISEYFRTTDVQSEVLLQEYYTMSRNIVRSQKVGIEIKRNQDQNLEVVLPARVMLTHKFNKNPNGETEITIEELQNMVK